MTFNKYLSTNYVLETIGIIRDSNMIVRKDVKRTICIGNEKLCKLFSMNIYFSIMG